MKYLSFVLLIGACLSACDINSWDPPIPPSTARGTHKCYDFPVPCYEWERCTRLGCEFVGDPNGPGPGDTDQEGSPAWPPSR